MTTPSGPSSSKERSSSRPSLRWRLPAASPSAPGEQCVRKDGTFALDQLAACLVDRREARFEPVAGGAQVEAPDADPFGAGEADGVVKVLVEAAGPVTQGLRIVGGEVLDMVGDEARPFERQQVPREVEGGGVGEDVALRERPRFGVGVAEPGDPVVEQAPAALEQAG